jgi:hypothetical protein
VREADEERLGGGSVSLGRGGHVGGVGVVLSKGSGEVGAEEEIGNGEQVGHAERGGLGESVAEVVVVLKIVGVLEGEPVLVGESGGVAERGEVARDDCVIATELLHGEDIGNGEVAASGKRRAKVNGLGRRDGWERKVDVQLGDLSVQPVCDRLSVNVGPNRLLLRSSRAGVRLARLL